MFKGLLKNFRKKLINLSGSNRSLLLLRLSKESDLDLNETDFLLNKSSFAIIENLIAGKAKFPLCTLLDSRNEQANKIGRALHRIARKDHFLFEESGACDLNIGWPFARGKFADGSLVRCPLLLFPVRLRLEDNVWQLYQRTEVPISFNKSFLLAWQHYNNLSLTEDFVETTFEGFSNESREFRTQLYDLLKSNSLEVHFNSDLFIDKLESFKEYKKADLDSETEDGRVKLFNEAVLGIFPQSGTSLVADYDALLVQSSEFKVQSLDDFFGSNDGNDNDAIRNTNHAILERDIQTPLPLDAPQENALKKVKAGESIVVQGPPGTGKSQLICNLVSDFVSRGKRVLVVCQKRAALDVVFKRLSSIQIGDFVALVHDFKADRNAIYEKIGLQIEKIDAYKQSNNGLDTVFLERNYLEACRKIDHSVAQLEEFKSALFDTSECGISIKELYLKSNNSAVKLNKSNEYYKHFTFEKWNAFASKLKYLASYALKFDSSTHPWEKRINFKNYAHNDRQKLAESLAEIHRLKEAFTKHSLSASTEVSYLWQIRASQSLLIDLKSVLHSIDNKLDKTFFYSHFQKFTNVPDVENKLNKWQKKVSNWKAQYQALADKSLLLDIDDEHFLVVSPIINKAKTHSESFLGRLKWAFFSKERKDVQLLLKANSLLETKEGISELHIRMTHSSTFLELRKEVVQSKDFLFTIETSVDRYLKHIESVELAFEYTTKWLTENTKSLIPVHFQKTSIENFKVDLSELIIWIENIERFYQANLFAFSETHLHQLFSSDSVYDALQTLDSEFDAMIEYDQAKDKLSFQELHALEDIVESLASNSSDPIDVFLSNVKKHWIAHIEQKYPILRSVSTPTMAMLETELNEAIADKQKWSREILTIKLREQVYRNEEFNRLGNRTTFRDLHHQATKKKKIWPLRKTLDAFHEEVFQVLPCWLASPETVSSIFPMVELFDLVVFDEASQCFAEKGIPSIARAKQIVIAGDSKQLQPSDLYRVRFNEDDEDIPETEIDSLLELACRYLPQVMLTEHYRSKSLDLVDFSNRHFYKNKLQLLPDFETYQSAHRGIEFIKTAGVLESNSNRVEAEKVVDLCVSLFQSEPDKELGVITFNIHQQHLIQDLIEERCVAEKRNLPVSFFVKNLENVQGDEKDIVIFSIGYAPDLSGRMSHQFGSLNMAGGENRLNVAVTRAKEKVIVVSSINPQQLHVENALHEGPKLLKKYLEYALEVSEGRFQMEIPKLDSFRQDWYLKEKLKKENPQMREQFPFADLSENDANGRFVQLLLTDDDKFYNSLSVKESFSYFSTSLRNKHWKFERKWSRNFSTT